MLKNITLAVSDLFPISLELEDVEIVLPGPANISIKIIAWTFIAMILISNGILIYFISMKNTKLTDLDKMMLFDSILCMCNIIKFIKIAAIGEVLENFCYLLNFFGIFNSYCKVLLSKGIVVYSYVSSIIMLSATQTLFDFYFRENWIQWKSKKRLHLYSIFYLSFIFMFYFI